MTNSEQNLGSEQTRTQDDPAPAGDCWDLAIVGAGAAGLMAAIQAGRAARGAGRVLRIVLLDSARTLGAKILVAGGGRCNVTHHEVSADDFAGASRPAIAKVLRALPVGATLDFFAELGVELVREETGKLFPTTNSGHTVLDALLDATRHSGVMIRHPWRVESITPLADRQGFRLHGAPHERPIDARRVLLATGGKSLPKTGSDGSGYALAESLGHTLTPYVLPALVPLLLPREHPLTELSGISAPVRLLVVTPSGRVVDRAVAEGSLLFTHFGLSGPVVLDISRHFLVARLADPGVALRASFFPDQTPEALDRELRELAARPGSRSIGRWLGTTLPDRLVDTLCALAGVDPATPGHRLTREGRQRLVATLTSLTLPIHGDRGFQYAEVTAGGVPLGEIDTRTMESRRCPGLHLAGEILDVDGRIGGFNFQWAWASGTVAGRAAAAALVGSAKD